MTIDAAREVAQSLASLPLGEGITQENIARAQAIARILLELTTPERLPRCECGFEFYCRMCGRELGQ